jgi:hypothetical protein
MALRRILSPRVRIERGVLGAKLSKSLSNNLKRTAKSKIFNLAGKEFPLLEIKSARSGVLYISPGKEINLVITSTVGGGKAIKAGYLQRGTRYLSESERELLMQFDKKTKGRGGWHSKNALVPRAELEKQKLFR